MKKVFSICLFCSSLDLAYSDGSGFDRGLRLFLRAPVMKTNDTFSDGHFGTEQTSEVFQNTDRIILDTYSELLKEI